MGQRIGTLRSPHYSGDSHAPITCIALCPRRGPAGELRLRQWNEPEGGQAQRGLLPRLGERASRSRTVSTKGAWSDSITSDRITFQPDGRFVESTVVSVTANGRTDTATLPTSGTYVYSATTSEVSLSPPTGRRSAATSVTRTCNFTTRATRTSSSDSSGTSSRDDRRRSSGVLSGRASARQSRRGVSRSWRGSPSSVAPAVMLRQLAYARVVDTTLAHASGMCCRTVQGGPY